MTVEDIPNTIFVPDSSVTPNNPVSYGLSFVNNPINFGQNIHSYNKLYTNHILFFHKQLPAYLKKEDIYLINNDITKYPKYSFCPNLSGINNVKYINYGFKTNVINSYDNRPLDVVILYSTEARQADILKNTISSNGITCNSICITKESSYEEIIKKINSAKICIDTTDYYNVLFAVSCGCYGMTSIQTNDSEFIEVIDNFHNCLSSIKKVLQLYDQNYITKAINYITTKYDYDLFKQTMSSIIIENYTKAVLL